MTCVAMCPDGLGPKPSTGKLATTWEGIKNTRAGKGIASSRLFQTLTYGARYKVQLSASYPMLPQLVTVFPIFFPEGSVDTLCVTHIHIPAKTPNGCTQLVNASAVLFSEGMPATHIHSC
jgi:hypothetical protein